MQPAFMPKAMNLLMVSARRTALLADSPTLHLFTSDVILDENTQIADLEEPTGSWYAEDDAPAVSEVFDNADGSLKIGIGSSIFNYTGTDPAETIRGAYLRGATMGLFCAWNLDAPVEMANTMDTTITPVAALSFPPVG